MSNKFLKILGICILIIMLPVLITVSAVCLTEDAKNGGNGTYTVHSVYADDVKLSNKDGSWKLDKVPSRSYYTFSGVTVNGKTYAVEDKAVVLSKEQKTTFETDVKADKPITSAWVCDYSYINIEVDKDAISQYCRLTSVDFNTQVNDIEALEIFAGFEYSAIGVIAIETFDAYVDVNQDGSFGADECYTLVFNAEDRTASGDITMRTLLDKLAEQNVSVPKTTNSYSEILIG